MVFMDIAYFFIVVLLIVLKLTGVLSLPWSVVLLPVWLCLILAVCLAMVNSIR